MPSSHILFTFGPETLGVAGIGAAVAVAVIASTQAAIKKTRQTLMHSAAPWMQASGLSLGVQQSDWAVWLGAACLIVSAGLHVLLVRAAPAGPEPRWLNGLAAACCAAAAATLPIPGLGLAFVGLVLTASLLCGVSLLWASHHADTLDVARIDPLTLVANRRLLDELAERALAAARRTQSPLTLLLLDFDGFRRVNETAGHDAADALLAISARRMCDALRGHDVVGRIDGDRFALLLTHGGGQDQTEQVIERIRKAIELPVMHEGTAMFPRVSIGPAQYPADGEHLPDLILAADGRLSKDKARRKDMPDPMRAVSG
ncbi:MAG TPA: GGDEF domain-containing protein [Burkholderiaceae bacterium]|nr:GGDEF domain-containing protein [Burkholderiaceae bacterium]